MPWPKEHKTQTRGRILEAAASVFRKAGAGNAGVAEIMRRAGLTHGAFYAHFSSKDELLAESVAHASAQTNEMLAAMRPEHVPNDLVATALAYLSERHLAHPERGCPIAALGPELARGSAAVRRTLAAAIRQRLGELSDADDPVVDSDTRRRRATGAFACMVGGLILARASTPADAKRLLEDCRDFIADSLASPH